MESVSPSYRAGEGGAIDEMGQKGTKTCQEAYHSIAISGIN